MNLFTFKIVISNSVQLVAKVCINPYKQVGLTLVGAISVTRTFDILRNAHASKTTLQAFWSQEAKWNQGKVNAVEILIFQTVHCRKNSLKKSYRRSTDDKATSFLLTLITVIERYGYYIFAHRW